MNNRTVSHKTSSSHIEPEFFVKSTFLPRIIKPRKRRKKERYSDNNSAKTGESISSTAFTFSVENERLEKLSERWENIKMSSIKIEESLTNANENSSYNYFSKNILPIESNNSVTSCSCHLCSPNEKIWTFQL